MGDFVIVTLLHYSKNCMIHWLVFIIQKIPNGHFLPVEQLGDYERGRFFTFFFTQSIDFTWIWKATKAIFRKNLRWVFENHTVFNRLYFIWKRSHISVPSWFMFFQTGKKLKVFHMAWLRTKMIGFWVSF